MTDALHATVISTARGPIEAAETGDGPAVLAIHGMPGDWRQARALAADLAPRFRVILPSRPGYGRTPLRTGRSPAAQADAYAALLDTLGVDTAGVVGISGGGPSARSFAARHPDRCRALVLCCPVAEHLVEVGLPMRVLGPVPGLWELGARVAARRRARAVASGAALSTAIRALPPAERRAAEADPRVREDLLAFERDRLLAMTCVPGLRNDFAVCRQAAGVPEPWPAGVTVPTLVLHGDADTVVGLDHARHHASTIPGAEIEVLPDTGHAFAITLRRTVSPRISAFLEAAS